jgi:hypothetical protein
VELRVKRISPQQINLPVIRADDAALKWIDPDSSTMATSPIK